MEPIIETSAKSFIETHKQELIAAGIALAGGIGLTWYLMRETDTHYIKKNIKKIAKNMKEAVVPEVKKE